MGYDIIGYKKIKNKEDKEIAYSSIAAWDRYRANILFCSLNAEKYDGGCSGKGVEKEYTRKEIEVAYEKFKYLLKEEANTFKNSEADKEMYNTVTGLFERMPNFVKDVNEKDRREGIEEIHNFFNDILKAKIKKVTIFFG